MPRTARLVALITCAALVITITGWPPESQQPQVAVNQATVSEFTISVEDLPDVEFLETLELLEDLELLQQLEGV
jgi:hypothetical protein